MTDGTAGGTYELTGVGGAYAGGLFGDELTGIKGAYSGGLAPSDFVVINNKEVLFRGVDASGNLGLWATNGTAPGTQEPNAANGNQSVKALVYVAAFAPDTGESVATLLRRFPGSTVEANTAAILLADGSRDLYFQPDKFRAQYAADLPETETKLLALEQLPFAERVMTDASDGAAWKSIPSWFIFGTRDNSIPANLLAFMAERAGSKKTVTIEGASHAVMMSHADAVVELVEQAASAVRRDRSTASA